MRVALYARVSTRDRGQEVANQLDQLRGFASTQGWEVTGEYVDQESGATAARGQFQRLLTDAARRRFDLVLFWALDRFSREGARQTLNHLQWLTQHGVGYRSLTEPYLDSLGLFGEVVVSLLAVLAKQERVRLSERTKAGLARAVAKGKTLGRPAAAVADARLQELVRQGWSAAQIAADLGVGRSTVQRRMAALAQQEPGKGGGADAGDHQQGAVVAGVESKRG